MVTFFSCFLKSEKYELGIYLTKLTIKYLPRAKNDNIHTNRNILNMLSKTNKLLIFIHSNKAWRQKSNLAKVAGI